MQRVHVISRRHLLASAAAVGALRSLPAHAALFPTPEQTAGPFYPLTLPLDSDNDLVRVAGRSERAAGTILHLGGRVLDPEGRPIRGARLEIWQCDAFGVYHHPRDPRGPADPDFQGFGSTGVADDGAYHFRTIEPVPYPGRTPHIHFKVKKGYRELLTTQCYVKGEPRNERDGILRGVRDARARESLIVEFAPIPASKIGELAARFDIVLGVTPEVP